VQRQLSALAPAVDAPAEWMHALLHLVQEAPL
jgi:hypothetical protein